MTIVHHFTDGVYAKETHIAAGFKLTQHAHLYPHLSILAKGNARVSANGVTMMLNGPFCLTIEAGQNHEVEALSDVVWYCIHKSDSHEGDDVQIEKAG